MTAYWTIARAATAEIVVKRSRFLATCRRVESEAEARAVIEGCRKEHWDARHHCSAFVLGARSEIQRSSDDGEPSGTAGAPMLEVVKGAEISDVVVVVTRWFGGVLLGAGGLVRAYSDATRAGLLAAGRLQRQLHTVFALTTDHGDSGRLESELRSRGITVLEVTYQADSATLRCALPDAAADGFVHLVADLSAGSLVPEPIGQHWV